MLSAARIRRIATRTVRGIWQRSRIIFYRSLSDVNMEGAPTFNQPALMIGRGTLTFEFGVVIGYFPSPYFFSSYTHLEPRGEKSSIKIGEGTHINNNFCAIAEHANINIGKNCLIGFGVEIIDSDFHGLEISDRGISSPDWARSVEIQDNVFIGSNVKVTKGVVIGTGSVVANGSVVTKSVLPHTIVGGNPAQVIKKINQ